jgi:hypothetical protein
MKRYKIKLERTQNGKKLNWSNELMVDSNIPPKVGDGRALLVDPPIQETIVSVEEIKLI